jgi:uncharacterized protein YjbI with pentapeptide repeats
MLGTPRLRTAVFVWWALFFLAAARPESALAASKLQACTIGSLQVSARATFGGATSSREVSIFTFEGRNLSKACLTKVTFTGTTLHGANITFAQNHYRIRTASTGRQALFYISVESFSGDKKHLGNQICDVSPHHLRVTLSGTDTKTFAISPLQPDTAVCRHFEMHLGAP